MVFNSGVHKANESIRKLRLSKLRSGHPFLIFSEELPKRHSYLELPDGKIVVVTLKIGERDFTTVRELSQQEAAALRNSLQLDLVIE